MLIGMGESKYLRYLFLVTSDNAVVNSMDTLRKYFAHFSVRHKTSLCFNSLSSSQTLPWMPSDDDGVVERQESWFD